MSHDAVTILLGGRDVSCVHCRVRVQRCDIFVNTIDPSAEMAMRLERGD